MKVTERRLRKIIRETIEEISTPGDSRYGDARGGMRGSSSRGVSFPGHSAADDESYRQAGQRQQDRQMQNYDAQQNQQGLSSPGGSYVQGVGWVPGSASDQAADRADSNIVGGGAPRDNFFLILDSQVTRGDQGDIEHVPSGNMFTVQGDKSSSGTLIGDLNMAFQKSGSKNGSQRAKDVIRILMDHDLLSDQDIDPDLVSEIGVKGRDTKTIYPIEDYFMDFNNGFIKECRRIMRKVLR